MKGKTRSASLVLRNPKGNLSSLTVEYRDAESKFKRIDTGIRIVNTKTAQGQYKYWDASTDTIKANGSQDPQTDTKAAREKLADLKALITDLERELKRFPLVSELAAAKVAAEAPKPTENTEATLLSILSDYMVAQKHWQPATRKSFTTLKNSLEKFEESQDSPLFLSTIKLADISSFEDWQIEVYDYKNSTVKKRLLLLKQFLQTQITPALNPAQIKAKYTVLLTAPIIFSLKEIEALRTLDLTSNPRLERVRDLQIVQIFTGLRVSDLMKVRTQNIKTDTLVIREKKTNKVRRIPLQLAAIEVLRKYTQDGELKLPIISEPKFNDYLKEVAELVLGDAQVSITTKHREVISETQVIKAQQIITHTNRRTFCSMLLTMGYSIRETMYFSGHTSIQSFQRYMGEFEPQAHVAAEMHTRYQSLVS